MTNVQHTGATIPAAEADAFQQEIRTIMEREGLNFGPAVDYYIAQRTPPGASCPSPVDMTGWDAA